MNNQKAKSDAGKPKLSLVPRRIIFDIARIREYGNDKYPEGGIDNWKQVEPERYQDAAFRHFLAYLDDPHGVDAESGLPHLWHLACNIAFLCELEDPIIEVIEREKKRLIDAKKRENIEGKEGVNYPSKSQITMEEPSKTIPGATVQKYSNGKLNMQLSESTMKLYKDLRVEHMESEPGWTKWMPAWRETDKEAEYYRIEILTDKVQFGDYDYETGEIVPRL